MKLSTIWRDLERVARENGAIAIGATTLPDLHAPLFDAWIEAGHHASMSYLAKNRAVRHDPESRYPWARSVVSLLVPYASQRPPAPAGSVSNHVSRYALGDDYHDVLDAILRAIETELTRLVPGAKSWRHVDTGPLSDRAYAAQSGLGWIGRNSMLIREKEGSYFFIGTLLTSLDHDLAGDDPADRCGTCTRCVDACPTAAILPTRTIDSTLCISYATIEHRGPIDEPVAAHLEGNVFGCDICQEVCPWNGEAPEPHPAFIPRGIYAATPVTDLLHFGQADFSRLFRRSAVKRAKLDGMRRNVETMLKESQESARQKRE